jgi:hypothetical protein
MSSLSISNSTKFKEIKSWFSSTFPSLKIELYKNSHETGKGNSNSELLNEDKPLSDFGYSSGYNEIVIYEDYSTNLVEHIFKTKLNLNVQIFRLNKDIWIQTTATDKWTLREQMDRSKFHTESDNVA